MKSFIIDANLLLLAVVGKASRDYIHRHKRLQGYSLSDYDRLCDLLFKATRIVVTPNILTEVSNLARQIGEPARTKVSQSLRNFIQMATVVDERYVQSVDATCRKEFLRLGLTDSALLSLAADSTMLLTADLHLYLAATAAGYRATNFNHLRTD